MIDWIAPVLSLVLLTLAATVRAGGASLMRIGRADASRHAAEGRHGARAAADILENREMILPALGAVHSALMVAATVPAVWAIVENLSAPGLVVGLVVLGLVLFVAGDVLPRAVGRARSRAIAYRLAPFLRPIVDLGARFVDVGSTNGDDGHDEGADDDEEDEEEIELISSVLEFSDTLVREVMVPRPDMVTVGAGAGLNELIDLVEEHGVSRIPVVGEGVDDIVGLVIVKDLLPGLATGHPPVTVAEVIRPIEAVPETKRVFDLLREMQASRTHLAVVVDEYGATAGLVTIEDLLEELVGEITDEYDEDELLLVEGPEGRWAVDGRLPVEDLSAVLGVQLPEDEWDTVGGLVLGFAGRVPREGERFDVDGVSFTVTKVQGRRVAEVEIEHPASSGDPA
ncbi:MAG: hemolysin family protein [Acidimicrobiia bacterium]|jgi:putative hemolysin